MRRRDRRTHGPRGPAVPPATSPFLRQAAPADAITESALLTHTVLVIALLPVYKRAHKVVPSR